MKTKCLMLLSLLAVISGCASLKIGSDVAAGRRALLAGNNETALAYFHSAAQQDPNYRWGTAYQQGILSYVGRTEYAVGQAAAGERNAREGTYRQSRRGCYAALSWFDPGPQRRSPAGLERD